MRFRAALALTAACAMAAPVVFLPALLAAEGKAKHPVFVGARACAACHSGRGMGQQHCKWALSKHARAYAVLAWPESKEIARLSGIPQEPEESVVCLGCHATGAEAEAWEKDETFHVQQGVQCEKCHGAGSEYMDESVMRDPKAARAAGLAIPTMDDCLLCHQTKGSHVAVLKLPKLDMEKAWKDLAHPTPASYQKGRPPALPEPAEADKTKPKYVGAMACAACHKGPGMGYQFSRWRTSAHADAYGVLGTPAAAKMAAEMGVRDDPLGAPACLKCHSTGHHRPAGGFLASFAACEGVGCEACHGAGSDYVPDVVMRDKRAAARAGLLPVTKDTCLACHANAHKKPFDYEAARAKIAHPTRLPAEAQGPSYKTPLNMALRPDGRELYVACQASGTVAVIDVETRRKVAEIEVGHEPYDVAFSPDGRRAYVSNRLDDSVSVVDPVSRKVLETIPVGDGPHGLLTDRSGAHLYVLNTTCDSISVIDTVTLKETRRLAASRNPWSLALSPDGSRLYVTNTLSRFVPFRTASMSEVTVIDTGRIVVDDRVVIPGANLVQGVAWHSSGLFALVTLNRTKNCVPMTRLLQGWTITNGLGVVWRDGRVDEVLLDEPGLCFPDPTDVAMTPDGQYALVTSSGSNRVAVVDLPKLVAMLEAASDHDRAHVLPNHLGKPTEFIVKHIATRDSPRGVLVAPDGKTAFVAVGLDDQVTVIDLERLEAVERIDLGGPTEITQTRWGERLFHSADNTFRRQFSCHSCHPDGHVDGLTYDIQPDGLGVSPVDNRTLCGILDTAPFKWEGTNPSLQRQCGPRLAVFFTRVQPFRPDELAALDRYICTIPRAPNRYRPLGAELTPAQRRGKEMFDRTMTNDGRVMAPLQQCVTCHPPPLYTDGRRHDVGTKMPLDREARFDVPQLFNIYDSAPYLHNGIAETLEEIWTRYNPRDQHGITNDMTKDQLNDLVEYLNTL